MTVKTVSAFEAAIILYRGLGLIRSWSDFLADNVRGRQSVSGFTLEPCCRKKDGRGMRPRYATNDVVMFIRNVRSALPHVTPNERIEPVALAVVPGFPHWANKFDQHGNPIRKCSISAGARIEFGAGSSSRSP